MIRNKIYKIICSFILCSIVLSLSSCLKNGPYDYDFAGAGASVDLPLAASNTNGLESFSYNATVTSTSLPVYVNVASPQIPKTATSVTLALDTAYLSQYNTDNGTSFDVLPDSVYKTTGWDVTIPAGQRLDSMNVTFDFTKLDLNHNYVLPVTIKSASLPIEQWNHLLYYISVKNQFDGEYTVTGSFVDNTGSFTDDGVYPVDAYLITPGPYSVKFFDEGNNIGGKVINAGGSLSSFGAYDPVFTIDPTSGKVTSVTDAISYTDPSNIHGRYAKLDPSGVNKYDFATKTMQVTYDLIQDDLGTGTVRVVFNETYTYVGPRH